MHLPTVIKEIFLKEYPEFDNPKTKITVNTNGRFDKDGGDIVIETSHPKYPEYNTFIYYWFLLEFDENGNFTGKISFEKEREYNVLRVDITLGGIITERIYLKQSEIIGMDYSEREDLALKKFIKEKEQEIRKEIAEKILSGEIDLNFFVSDSDSYECPPSKIKDRIIEL